jgi:hypothetical protein
MVRMKLKVHSIIFCKFTEINMIFFVMEGAMKSIMKNRRDIRIKSVLG